MTTARAGRPTPPSLDSHQHRALQPRRCSLTRLFPPSPVPTALEHRSCMQHARASWGRIPNRPPPPPPRLRILDRRLQ